MRQFEKNKTYKQIINVKKSLPKRIAQSLLRELRMEVKLNKDFFLNKIKQFSLENKEYRVFEISKDRVMILKKNAGDKKGRFLLNIGFPFPIISYKLNSLSCINVNVDFCYRGETLRKFQRDMLNTLSDKLFWVYYDDPSLFKSQINQSCRNANDWIYVDPYTYIGDSIIGLHFMDAFKKKYNFKKFKVFSRAYNHLPLNVETYPIDPILLKKIIQDNSVVVMPDLIDTHWSTTLYLIKQICYVKSDILIVGRNMHIKMGEWIQINYFNSSDPLLRNKNIEEYMDDCLEIFLNLDRNYEKVPRICIISPKKILICPLSSSIWRDLPPELILSISEKLRQEGFKKIFISLGVYSNQKDRRWNKNFQKKLSERSDDLQRVCFPLWFKSLRDMAAFIKKENIQIAITADTSTAHLLNRLNIPNITIYHERSWDGMSVQSLASNSPLGFCRFGAWQFPMIMKDTKAKTIERYAGLALSTIKGLEITNVSKTKEQKIKWKTKFFNFKSQLNKVRKGFYKQNDFIDNYKNLIKFYYSLKRVSNNTWLFELYDPKKLLNKIIYKNTYKEIIPLVYSAFRISPVYKFFQNITEK
jgi:hypothetical protein